MSIEEIQDYYQSKVTEQQDAGNNPLLPSGNGQELVGDIINSMADGEIAAQGTDYIQFWQDGNLHYVSKTLRAGGSVIQGCLIKKSSSKMAAASQFFVRSRSQSASRKGKVHLTRFIMILFEFKRVIIRQDKDALKD